jgi:aspartate racemase
VARQLELGGGKDMKTIGVLGGIGPQATMDFEQRVHRAAQRLVPQRYNGGYPPMIVYYLRDVPFVADDSGLRPREPLEPNPKLLDAARVLGAASDFLVIISNGTHLLRSHVERASGRPVLSMVDATVRDVQRRGWRNVGVLGLGHPRVYTGALDGLHVAHETVDAPLRDALDEGIFGSMEGRIDPRWTNAALEAIEQLRSRGVDGVILGCTEIAIVLGEENMRRLMERDGNVIDPLDLLADTAVRHAMS